MADLNPFKDQDIENKSLPQDDESRYGSDIFNDIKQMQVGNGSQVFRADQSGIWLGAATFADAPFSVDMQGNVTATSITITGYIPTGGAAADVNSLSGGLDGISNGSTYFKTTANQVTGAGRAFNGLDSASTIIKGFLASSLSALSLPTTGVRIDQNGIYGRASGTTTFWIDASTGNATFAGTLLAASGTFGTVTAGTLSGLSISGSTITGGTVQTASSGLRTVLDGSTGRIAFMSGATVYSSIYPVVYPQGNGISMETTTADAFMYVSEGTHNQAGIGTADAGIDAYDTLLTVYGSSLTPEINNVMNLGSSSFKWADFYLQGSFNYRGINYPIIYFGYVSGTSVSSSNSGFTATNPSTGKYTITHNLGTTAYTVTATTLRGSGAGAYVCKIEQLNSNDFRVTVFDDTGTVQNGDFMFNLCKVS